MSKITFNDIKALCDKHIDPENPSRTLCKHCKAFEYGYFIQCYFRGRRPTDWIEDDVKDILGMKDTEYDDITVENFYTKRFNDIK